MTAEKFRRKCKVNESFATEWRSDLHLLKKAGSLAPRLNWLAAPTPTNIIAQQAGRVKRRSKFAFQIHLSVRLESLKLSAREKRIDSLGKGLTKEGKGGKGILLGLLLKSVV